VQRKESIVVSVLFVCLGNICRSPTAEGVFRSLVEQEGLSSEINVDSAGTSNWHIGGSPDRRATEAARKRGIDLSQQKARQVEVEDFENFDYILAMDRENFKILSKLSPAGTEDRLKLFLEFARHAGREDVPDPYYGGEDGFDLVLDLIEDASKGLLADIQEHQR
jgi:protein-tyrosine phosphatase